jgi:hypothetical protein
LNRGRNRHPIKGSQARSLPILYDIGHDQGGMTTDKSARLRNRGQRRGWGWRGAGAGFTRVSPAKSVREPMVGVTVLTSAGNYLEVAVT